MVAYFGYFCLFLSIRGYSSLFYGFFWILWLTLAIVAERLAEWNVLENKLLKIKNYEKLGFLLLPLCFAPIGFLPKRVYFEQLRSDDNDEGEFSPHHKQ